MNDRESDQLLQNDRFEIRRRLGAGGMGVVYEAFDHQRHAVVALKTLYESNAAAIYHLKQEFRALADIAHPNLVALHELITDGREWFLTMELVAGKPFLAYVRSLDELPEAETVTLQTEIPSATNALAAPAYSQRPARPLNAEQLVRLRAALVQLAEGLSALHAARKLHRDIKPSNVLVTEDGRVVLLDFGLVAELDRAGQLPMPLGRAVGTSAYMSPEQSSGESLTEASDWYSVGVMLFAALTGQLPFYGTHTEIARQKRRQQAPSPGDLVDGVPEDLERLCRDLLARQPQQRPGGTEVLRRLGVPQEPRTGAAGGWTALAARRDVLFVGRQQPLHKLHEACERVGPGRPVVVQLSGRSGVGKTALVERFLEDFFDREDVVVLRGRCYEREAVPYKALDSLVDALSRYLLRCSDDRLTRLLPRDVRPLARLFPVLRRVPAVEALSPGPSEIPDQSELRRRAFAGLRYLLTGLGSEYLLLLVIDDLQWGDEDSALLLTDLFQPPRLPSLLLIACYRSEDEAMSPFLRTFLHAQQKVPDQLLRYHVQLEPLTTQETRQLVQQLLAGGGQPDPELVEAVAQESGGNPYFVAELLRYLSTGGGLASPQPGGRRIALDEVLQHRVAKLPDADRLLLELIAVAGRPLPLEVARQASGLGAATQASLAVLRAAHLIRATGVEREHDLEIYHDRIRETVAGGLSSCSLQERHLRLATAWQKAGSADPETLATHFLGAGDGERASVHFEAAAARAADTLAFQHSAELYRKALHWCRSVTRSRRLRIRLGDALANAGRGHEAAEAYRLAVPGAKAAERLELQRCAAMQSLISGHIDEGLLALRDVLNAVQMQLPGTPRRAYWSLARRRLQLRLRGLRFRQRDSSQIAAEQLTRIDICWSAAVGLSIVDTIRGADFQTRNLLLSLRAGEPYRVARALAWEAAHVATGGGRAHRRTSRLLQTAERLAERLEHPHAAGLCTLSRGIEAYMQGRWQPARVLAERANEIFRERCTGVTWEIDTAQSFLLWSLYFLGEVEQLHERLPVLLKEAGQRGDLYAATNLGTFVGYLRWLAADDPRGARDSLHEVMGQWSQQGFHVQHLTGLMAQLQIDLYCGDGAAAWRRINEQWQALEKSMLLRVQTVRIFMLHLRARSALSAAAEKTGEGPREKLIRAAEADARRIERERMQWGDPLARLIRATAATQRGDVARATHTLATAAAEFDAVDMALFAAATRYCLGKLLEGTEGWQLVQQAQSWMSSQGIRNCPRMAAQHVSGLHR